MNVLERDELGVKTLLHTIKLLRDKNEAYFHGTFNWLIKNRSPFAKSHMLYDPDSNSFKWFTKPILYTEKGWNDFGPNDYIKELHFSYSSTRPFGAIVSDSVWVHKLLNARADDIAINKAIEVWVADYHSKATDELLHFQKILLDIRRGGSIPLF